MAECSIKFEAGYILPHIPLHVGIPKHVHVCHLARLTCDMQSGNKDLRLLLTRTYITS